MRVYGQRSYPGFGDVPPAMRVSVHEIPGGDKGTKATLDRMRKIVIESLKDARHGAFLRGLAIKITLEGGCKTKAFGCEAKSIHDWCRDNLKWIRDIRGFETLQYPYRTLAFGGGDAFRKDTPIIVRKKIDETYKVVELGDLEHCFAEYDALSFSYEKGEFEFKPIVAWYDKGVKPMYRIETNNHRVLDVSTKHKVDAFFYGPSQKYNEIRRGVEAQELFGRMEKACKPQLPFATKIPELGTVNHVTSDQLFLEGMYLAEGWPERHSSGARTEEGDEPSRVCIGVKDEVLFGKIESSANALGIKYYTHTQSNGVKVLRTSDHAFRKNLITKFGKGSFEKTIPEEYLSLPREKMTEFVGAYAAGDAYKPKPGSRWSKMANLIHNTSSSMLARMLGLAHLIMGRPLHPMLQMNHMGAGHSPIWRLIERKNTKCYRPRIGDVAGASIHKFEENGEAECCDVTVLDNHNVVTEGGIIVHQCDDLTAVESTLMIEIGFPVRLKAIAANPARKSQFSHVYLQVDVKGNGSWISADPTVKSAEFGWESPLRYREMILEI